MSRKPYTIRATYGSYQTPCTLYVLPVRKGWWYAVEGSQNVNCTPEEPSEGCDIEELSDIDTFTWPKGINCEETLEAAVDA
jgi:hypothetical protein